MAEKGTYWTCFAFDGIPPSELHCTHKYLGKLSDEQAADVELLLELGFMHGSPLRPAPIKITFEKEEWFGEEKDKRVLVPSIDVRDQLLPDLKAVLDEYRVDDFPEYNPHVTTVDLIKVDHPITRYCFLKDDEILAEWSFEQSVPGKQKALTLPDVRQRFPYDCGGAAVLSVLQFFGVTDYDEDSILTALGTDEINGTDPQSVCHFLETVGLMYEDVDRMMISDLGEAVAQGWPVLVCIQDWEENPTQIVNQQAGHWVVVVDANDEWVTVQDPNSGLERIPAVDFLGRWHDYAGTAPFDDSDQRYVHYGIAVKKPPSGLLNGNIPMKHKSVKTAHIAQTPQGWWGIVDDDGEPLTEEVYTTEQEAWDDLHNAKDWVSDEEAADREEEEAGNNDPAYQDYLIDALDLSRNESDIMSYYEWQASQGGDDQFLQGKDGEVLLDDETTGGQHATPHGGRRNRKSSAFNSLIQDEDYDDWRARLDQILQYTKGTTHEDYDDWKVEELFTMGATPQQAAVALVAHARQQGTGV